MRSSSRVDDIASTPASLPVQPIINYPATIFSGKARSFSQAWYNAYPWLEYSVQVNACFCYSCCLFGPGPGSKCDRSFTVVGFRDWKHATGKSGVLSKHDSSFAHRQSMLTWNQYKLNLMHKTTISDQPGLCWGKQIAENCHYIRSLAETILSCSHQEIALRGHKEGEEFMNIGNFLAILNLAANHDSVIKEPLMNGPKNAKYTSLTYRILL